MRSRTGCVGAERVRVEARVWQIYSKELELPTIATARLKQCHIGRTLGKLARIRAGFHRPTAYTSGAWAPVPWSGNTHDGGCSSNFSYDQSDICISR